MKSVLLIGLGKFGRYIAKELQKIGHEVLAIDGKEERVNEAMSFVTSAQIGDCTQEEFLKTLGVRNFDVCMVTISKDFQSSLETTCLLKELGAKLVISRAERDGQEKFLLRNGAERKRLHKGRGYFPSRAFQPNGGRYGRKSSGYLPRTQDQ